MVATSILISLYTALSWPDDTWAAGQFSSVATLPNPLLTYF